MIGHIGNIPVEEWLPFVVPIVALFLYIRRKERRRRQELRRLPDARELLDEPTIERVLLRWRERDHEGASARHIPLLYPPGPDGMTAAQLAAHANSDIATVERLVDELEELGYLELENEEQAGAPIIALTIGGYDLVIQAESVLLAVAREREASARERGRAGR